MFISPVNVPFVAVISPVAVILSPEISPVAVIVVVDDIELPVISLAVFISPVNVPLTPLIFPVAVILSPVISPVNSVAPFIIKSVLIFTEFSNPSTPLINNLLYVLLSIVSFSI